ncbi:trehalose-6-phosphate synthase isoform X1 [Zea mays]|uniref:alpha,alpha-trehalose-phosphate synthase (UDP-forming) n=2 Tax=Zea mays TaxID=4577 RepID=D2KLI5_MAIZE|nr:trehalose-6-phosphate synthase [Zea mays]XP_020402772.1 trehalose-6-phosphate synthase isoform X1 [Zea mays]XP_020402775.1 trehalose-6-phosphate synthase isoform X1 [Zea mays]XP_035820279.1 trehalose-6-phosphate synthase isoform X1 [Zea mays]ADA67991.1 trehalose-6-phosphate synthase [Zea mays]ONL95323.1 trehalose-6-phosphate synthase2 [Zea mays]ONL95326.1 trehalose-6-phosphate synthase2 [Zea mays]|eukprot:NP_001335721.1 trehalose-6-phosphate synthase [Zea mays]
MASRSYSNLLDLATGAADQAPAVAALGALRRRLPRVVTTPGLIDDSPASPSTPPRPRTIIVANQLPIRSHRPESPEEPWTFEWDEDSLLRHLHHSSSPLMEFIYIGCLRDDIPQAEQDAVAQALLETHNCVPAFLPTDIAERYYHGFCKQHLWPLFHYMLPLSPDLGGRFDRALWQAYVSANKIFADKVLEVINPDDDFVWVHDYHLMVLPTFLRKRFNRIKLGFFLHSPFPSSEIYKTLPVREELLRALLNSDLIGFHTFDYARHFLSCCGRMLGLSYESKRGHICLEYYGRTVSIKILPVGVHMEQLKTVLGLPETEAKVSELMEMYSGKGRVVMLGVDDMDIFKGISLKLLAMEELLRQHPEWRGKLVLVQVANPARGRGKDVAEVQTETYAMVRRINEVYGEPGYEPVVLIDEPLQFYERVAYYVIAEVCLVTAVRDGMNLIPYEYIVSRQGNEKLDRMLRQGKPEEKKSMLVVSEFIGCSPSLSGAIRVNPWNIEAVADAMETALVLPENEKRLRHDKHFRYVSTHDVGYWANSFLLDLERTCKYHSQKRCWGIGFGLRFRVVSLDLTFRKLSLENILMAYRRAKTRAILLDYDGTLMPQAINKSPSTESVRILNSLCRDKDNVVYLCSGYDRRTLHEWFPCENLGIAAEHGYFLRCKRDAEWKTCVAATDCSWKQIAEPVMCLYRETTDGSTIEDRETVLVWNYEDADPDFGSCQAKELVDHLESVLANEPVSVKTTPHSVEVKPQGVSKGLVARRMLVSMKERGQCPDFVLCIGDDKSDEDMFQLIATAACGDSLASKAEVFACTVGRKPSKAKYYLDDAAEVVRLMQGLSYVSEELALANQRDEDEDSSLDDVWE